MDLQTRRDCWSILLNYNRLGKDPLEPQLPEYRDEFERDFDRIVFSSAFRRLKDKTQVFPMSPNDYTRTRLTHTLEVASVGRSLGTKAGKLLQTLKIKPDWVEPGQVGTIVATACLAHDVGNPPFGHSGESSIQEWATKYFAGRIEQNKKNNTVEPWLADIKAFEGNAQSFRIYTRLQARERHGGLRLTYATLATLIKYPCGVEARVAQSDGQKIYSKFGFFQAEAPLARNVFTAVGLKEAALGRWQRHPLAFLMEAADDICNHVIDLEDACRMKIFTSDQVLDLYGTICDLKKIRETEATPDEKVNAARAMTINVLVEECFKVFEANLEGIEAGTFQSDLISQCSKAAQVKTIFKRLKKDVFTDPRVLEVEIAGFKALGGLLDLLAQAHVTDRTASSSEKIQVLLATAGHPFEIACDASVNPSEYQRYLAITDYVSGMTDGYAVSLFQRLTGIAL
jgi:dGTPase